MATVSRQHSQIEIDPAVESSWTLPTDVYLDPGLLVREKESLFGNSWQIVGRRDQVGNTGDYFTAELVGEPLLIVRGSDGVLRGFYNVCRHRAGPPAEGCGSRKVFRCGYHGWTYSLDGRLLNAPEMDGTRNFDHSQFGLQAVPIGEWGAWVFVNLDTSAEALVPSLRELPNQALKYSLQDLKLVERREYVMECNWKVYIDNFLEGYHLPSVHPSLNRELDYGQYITETFEFHSRQASPIRGPSNEKDAQRRYSQASGDEEAEYFWIFPNWMLNCYPDNVSLNIVLPLSVERCVAIFEWYFPKDALDTNGPAQTIRFSDEIQIEDGHICEVVQRNLKSRSYTRGRFSAKQEKGVHQFHRLYSQWMAQTS
ncbi:MAG TPA: aromatic ring-hydroxylating dioxygenase subunit alpha [Terriglobales bacterium]|jgi:choline monooxygenase|nr:aromatic ring-hydroxylating dioxygenase subunit alpha [Terriglobales bacterium]